MQFVFVWWAGYDGKRVGGATADPAIQ
jgi:hypothetical protein